MAEPRRFGKSASQYRREKDRYDRQQTALDREVTYREKMRAKLEDFDSDYRDIYKQEISRSHEVSRSIEYGSDYTSPIARDDGLAKFIIAMGLLAIGSVLLYAVFVALKPRKYFF